MLSAACDTCNEQVALKQEEKPENEVTRAQVAGSRTEHSSCGDRCEWVTGSSARTLRAVDCPVFICRSGSTKRWIKQQNSAYSQDDCRHHYVVQVERDVVKEA